LRIDIVDPSDVNCPILIHNEERAGDAADDSWAVTICLIPPSCISTVVELSVVASIGGLEGLHEDHILIDVCIIFLDKLFQLLQFVLGCTGEVESIDELLEISLGDEAVDGAIDLEIVLLNFNFSVDSGGDERVADPY
jgi:hypothetical protein